MIDTSHLLWLNKRIEFRKQYRIFVVSATPKNKTRANAYMTKCIQHLYGECGKKIDPGLALHAAEQAHKLGHLDAKSKMVSIKKTYEDYFKTPPLLSEYALKHELALNNQQLVRGFNVRAARL